LALHSFPTRRSSDLLDESKYFRAGVPLARRDLDALTNRVARFRANDRYAAKHVHQREVIERAKHPELGDNYRLGAEIHALHRIEDRKSTRLNSSHSQ